MNNNPASEQRADERPADKFEHTPGPWRVFTAKGNCHKIIGIGDINGVGITDCGFGVWRGGSAEALANAHLIAAAPDMLAALKAARDQLQYLQFNIVRPSGSVVTHVETAIAKAEGRS